MVRLATQAFVHGLQYKALLTRGLPCAHPTHATSPTSFPSFPNSGMPGFPGLGLPGGLTSVSSRG